MDKNTERKRTSKIAKNEDISLIPSKCPKKDKKLESLTKAQLIQKCIFLESSVIELKKLRESSILEVSNLKEELQKLNENKNTISSIQTHTQTYPTNDVDYNCGVCVFQSSSEDPLWSHMDIEHDIQRQKENASTSCKKCLQVFHIESDLMYHIKIKHEDIVKPCKYFLQGRCNFSDEICWNSHRSKSNQSELTKNDYKCKYCDKVINSKNELMKHRKINHLQRVAFCRENVKNQCRYNDECWYQHKTEDISKNETLKVLTDLDKRIKIMEKEIESKMN